ncbi:MAG TPA: 16S rRNA (uracil(1498)-N(3))-methyltransferase [Desulfurivibrionaceae bacterium]|nr:16S rRNA (uracil(1498)-N(3))-methyltransferase [Desulfurivibrionaceae bacterium]
MRRFLVDPAAITGATALLTGSEAHHLAKVLRLKTGEKITLLDTTGARHEAEIGTITRDAVHLTILASSPPEEETTALHLGQGLLKGKKMDLVVQKATELGIAAIHPFVSQHTVARIDEAAKDTRWQRIALEACKQCNRPQPPQCHPVHTFADLLAEAAPFPMKLLFWEGDGGTPLHHLITQQDPPTSLFFLIGPEGGFSKAEHDLAVAAGFTAVTLGRRTLRAETAAIAAAAILQFLIEAIPRDFPP